MITRKTRQIVTFWTLIWLLFLFSGGYIMAKTGGDTPSPLVITEFLVGNDSGQLDEQGERPDWIEIYNRSDRAVNLAGWSLTDDADRPDKWTFPDQTLGSHEYLVIFASGKDANAVEPDTLLHTNFKLSKTDRFLALYNIFEARFMDVITLDTLGYFRGISYGRYEEVLGYFTTPTPGQPNDTVFIKPEDVPTVATFKEGKLKLMRWR